MTQLLALALLTLTACNLEGLVTPAPSPSVGVIIEPIGSPAPSPSVLTFPSPDPSKTPPLIQPAQVDYDGNLEPWIPRSTLTDCKITGHSRGRLIRTRPMVAADDHINLVVANIKAHGYVNQMVIHITMTNGVQIADSALVKNVEVYDVNRDVATDATCGHHDLVMIDGSNPGREALITLEDVNLHDSTQYSLIHGLRVSKLLLKNVRMNNVKAGLQLGFTKGKDEYVRELIIEDSPGLHVTLAAPSGQNDIRKVTLIRSPGVTGLESLGVR